MTRKVKVGLNSTGIIDRFHAQSFAFPVDPFEFGVVSDLLAVAPEKDSVEYPISTVYRDCHPFLKRQPIQNRSYLSLYEYPRPID